MKWATVERPGHFGRKRDEIYRQFDEKYGAGKWRIMWQWDTSLLISYIDACRIYEYSYYADSFRRDDLWKELASKAKNVYDHQESDIESGLDYMIQKGTATHLQDIAIRRVLARRGLQFQGSELIQIRSHKTYWGKNLSPGKVPFHIPQIIAVPRLEGWWDASSIEDFWQSNKMLQVRK